MSLADDIQRAFTLIRQLQGALGGLSIRAGYVQSNGVTGAGSGFSSVKNATGDYTLTFDPPFRSAAAVVAMQGSVGGTVATIKQYGGSGATASTFRLASVGVSSGSLVDSDFWFIACG